MNIAINTSGAVTGGAVTHLRHLLPPLVASLDSGDRLTLIGTDDTRDQIDPDRRVPWRRSGETRPGLLRRAHWERRQLPQILREIDADVLFHPANITVPGSPVPQVTLIHNLAPFLDEVTRHESLRQKARLRLLRFLTGRSLQQARRTIFVSEWGKRLVLRHFPMPRDPGPVIPFGSEHAVVQPATDCLRRLGLAESRFILSVSHFYRYKRMEDLIDAYVQLGDAVSELPLVIAGAPFDPDYAHQIRARSGGAVGRVIFTGALGAADVSTLMRHCLAFVFTSCAENLPLTLLEAMALGAPILTNRACSMPEVCADAALYVDAPSADAYAAGLGRILASSELRRELRERAFKRSAAFRWSTASARTLEVLRHSGTGVAQPAPAAADGPASSSLSGIPS